MGPELRQLAQAIVGMLEPLVQAGVAYATAAKDGAPAKCTRVWCPVCAAAALASGEQHPLIAVIAENGAALLSLLGALVQPDAPTPPGDDSSDTPHTEPPSHGHGHGHGHGRYQPIAVTIHE